jgi:hypothetical protein
MELVTECLVFTTNGVQTACVSISSLQDAVQNAQAVSNLPDVIHHNGTTTHLTATGYKTNTCGLF